MLPNSPTDFGEIWYSEVFWGVFQISSFENFENFVIRKHMELVAMVTSDSPGNQK